MVRSTGQEHLDHPDTKLTPTSRVPSCEEPYPLNIGGAKLFFRMYCENLHIYSDQCLLCLNTIITSTVLQLQFVDHNLYYEKKRRINQQCSRKFQLEHGAYHVLRSLLALD